MRNYHSQQAYIRNVGRAIKIIETEYNALSKLLADAESGRLLINSTEGCPQSIKNEIEAQLASTEKFMNEQLGVKFNMTVDKAEVDTFLRTHISSLIFAAYGKPNHSSVGVVGKAENLYKMLATEDYGLMISELDLLRYLEANREMTDADLIAKYKLSETKTSVEGLILFLKELLGESYTFDPIIAEVENGIENNIRDYFVSMLYMTVTGLSEGSVVPSLNFVPQRLNDKGRLVPNTANINAVNKLINTEIDALLLSSKTGVIETVTDGNYDLYTLITEAQMTELIDKAVEIIRLNTRTEDNAIPTDKAVEYATPETMKADIRNYVEGRYYQAVINKMDSGEEVSLYVQTVSSKTGDSIETLVGLRNETYGEIDAELKYETYVKKMLADAELAAILAGMNDTLKGAYGDVSEQLMNAYLKVFATTVLGKDKAPTIENYKREDPDNEEEKISLRDEVKALVEEKLSTITIDTVDTLIAEVEAIHANYELDDDYDVHANSAEYVYFHFLSTLKDIETVSYYYDPQMAKMDATVLGKVAEKNAAIMAALPEGFTKYDLYDAIVASLADPEDSVYDFAAAVAAEITHVAEGKYSIEDDVLAYYCYELLNSFEGYELGDAPAISMCYKADGTQDANKYNNALTIISNDLEDRLPLLISEARASAKRGEMPNYALSSFKTAEDMDAIANELVDALISALFVTEEERETIAPELKEYVQHAYYVEVLDRLNANDKPSFHVSEIYGSTLYDAAIQLKDLMYYFVTTETDMTEQVIDQLISTGGGAATGDEEEEEASRYLSDDGRIVSVTYGDKNADGSYSAYKTFILNYNNFSVSVEYDGVTYTIPAYGYVIVMHEADH